MTPTEAGRTFSCFTEDVEGMKEAAALDALYFGYPGARITTHQLPDGRWVVSWYWSSDDAT